MPSSVGAAHFLPHKGAQLTGLLRFQRSCTWLLRPRSRLETVHEAGRTSSCQGGFAGAEGTGWAGGDLPQDSPAPSWLVQDKLKPGGDLGAEFPGTMWPTQSGAGTPASGRALGSLPALPFQRLEHTWLVGCGVDQPRPGHATHCTHAHTAQAGATWLPEADPRPHPPRAPWSPAVALRRGQQQVAGAAQGPAQGLPGTQLGGEEEGWPAEAPSDPRPRAPVSPARRGCRPRCRCSETAPRGSPGGAAPGSW